MKCQFCQSPVAEGQYWKLFFRETRKLICFCNDCSSDMARFINDKNTEKSVYTRLREAVQQQWKIIGDPVIQLSNTGYTRAINQGIYAPMTVNQVVFPTYGNNASNLIIDYLDTIGTASTTNSARAMSFKTMREAQKEMAKIQKDFEKQRGKKDVLFVCPKKIVPKDGRFHIV